MDYSELVAAINNNDTEKINTLMKGIRPRLLAFLRIHMNASETDAQDISQDAMLTTLEVIREGRLKEPKQVVKYMLSICRNTYLKEQKKHRTTSLDQAEELTPKQSPRQLESLLDQEQSRLLKWCLEQLKDDHREYIQYWLKHPGMHTQRVADHFKISVNNAWTRKHRLIKKLSECYKKKSNL